MNDKNIIFNSNIKFKYYFKLNNKVKKVVIKYYDLLDLLELRNKKDNKNNYYINGYTYQLQQIQNTLLNNKDLKIFKCDIFVNDEIIL
tara:strand:+ start:349 stop:612 length:264 start_codon:yes stop_codon:yes gene_type:complete